MIEAAARQSRNALTPSGTLLPAAGQFDSRHHPVHGFAMNTTILIAAVLSLGIVSARAADSIYDIPLKDIDGKSALLKPHQGKVLLVVNVASKCGYTPQYTALEALFRKYKDQGLTVLGFPCNQFGGQEPGTAEEIKQFCSSKYDVTFPLFEKIEVNGANRHPLYTMLAGKDSPVAGDIKWNFTKFLIGRDGKILKRFESPVKPDSTEAIQAIESALAVK
jgi:glutathione peroxidase